MADDDRDAVRRGAPAGRPALPGRARTTRLLVVTVACLVASTVVLVVVFVAA